MRSELFAAKVETDPQNPLLRFSLGQALFSEGSYEQAVPHLRFCANHRDDWMLPRILLGKALLQCDDKPAARELFEDALRLAIAQHHEGPEAELRALLADTAG